MAELQEQALSEKRVIEIISIPGGITPFHGCYQQVNIARWCFNGARADLSDFYIGAVHGLTFQR
jgi:hypothetical protein